MTEKDNIQAQLAELKANQPLLVALIKDVMRESLSISINADVSNERENVYMNISASISVDDEHVCEDNVSAYMN